MLPVRVCFIGFVLGSFLILGCARFGERGRQLDKDAIFHYPRDFIIPTVGKVGYGMAPLYRFSHEESYEQAASMALRQLSWTYPVRVWGERLYEHGPDGSIDFRGQEVDIEEQVKIDSASCTYDTLASNGWVWVSTRATGSEVIIDTSFATMEVEAPPWLESLPREEGYVYSMGVSEISYGDEAGGWEIATYSALVDLAFSLFSKPQHLVKNIDGEQVGMTKIDTDVVIDGFQVVERWRDRRRLNVLVRTTVAILEDTVD